MEGVIKETGQLYLRRGSTYREQVCPFTSDVSSCGDWCPMFGEPFTNPDGTTDLYICGRRRLYFEKGDFVDERS